VIAISSRSGARGLPHRRLDAGGLAQLSSVATGAEACAVSGVELSSRRRAAHRPASPCPHSDRGGKHIAMSMSKPMRWPAAARGGGTRGGRRLSLAYGDQPALTCELVDWGGPAGSRVAAGRHEYCRPIMRSRLTTSGRITG